MDDYYYISKEIMQFRTDRVIQYEFNKVSLVQVSSCSNMDQQ